MRDVPAASAHRIQQLA